jgi:hypothetical protein
MNDKAVIAAGFVAAGAIITAGVQTVRVSFLKNGLRIMESRYQATERTRDRALAKLDGDQLLDLLDDTANDILFYDITKDF